MEIKHQVFVSSTYRDLTEERKAVIHALLELDCIPAGMELFPASDEDAWTLIREVIDGCDYYILILAGKYGSLGPDGIGYTEKEFDYAVTVGKPILVFLHEKPEDLPASDTEKTEVLQVKLAEFKEKAKAKHCKFWNGSEDLGGKVSRSLISLRKRHPSPGWVPGKFAATEAMLRELQELRARIAEMEIAALISSNAPPPGSDQLAQGNDLVPFKMPLNIDGSGVEKETDLTLTWDKIFSYIGPSLVTECTDNQMMEKIQLAYYHALPNASRNKITPNDIILPYVHEDKLRIQFQALGLIAPGIKRRAVSDTGRYWRLTPLGEKHLLSIKAERRPTP